MTGRRHRLSVPARAGERQGSPAAVGMPYHARSMEPGLPYSATEMMIVASARQLAGERVCFVGVGPPNIACNLAKRTVARDLELVYESGVFGSAPARLPLSIGDPLLGLTQLGLVQNPSPPVRVMATAGGAPHPAL